MAAASDGIKATTGEHWIKLQNAILRSKYHQKATDGAYFENLLS